MSYFLSDVSDLLILNIAVANIIRLKLLFHRHIQDSYFEKYYTYELICKYVEARWRKYIFKSKARLSPSNAHFKQKGKLTIIKVVIGTITDMLKKIIFVVKSAWEIQIHWKEWKRFFIEEKVPEKLQIT